MNITSINYTKTYNLGSYQSEKIGVEISINEGENAIEALDTAKKLCQEFHDKNNPEPFVSGVVPIKTEDLIDNLAPPTPKLDKKTAKEQQEQNMINLITSCKQIDGADGLKTYEKLSSSNAKFQEAYSETLLKLRQNGL